MPTDPAVEAARRAWGDPEFRKPFDSIPATNFVRELAVNSAREALAPIRALHERMTARAAHEDAEVEYGMTLVLDALAPLIYREDEL